MKDIAKNYYDGTEEKMKELRETLLQSNKEEREKTVKKVQELFEANISQ